MSDEPIFESAADQNWVIVDAAGVVLDQVITSGTHPRFHGYPWDGATMTAHMVDRTGDLAVELFDVPTLSWIMATAKAEAIAIAQLDAKQETAFENLARAASAVGELHTWREIQDLKLVQPDSAVTSMSGPIRKARWPFIIALMTESGTPLANFRAFADTVEAELTPRVQAIAKVSAKALLARREVRKAATAEAKLAAAAVDLEG